MTNPRKKNNIPLFRVENTLGFLELEVMRIIWHHKVTTVREVVELLNQRRPIAYTTVMTVMDNLYKKGFLTRKKVEKSYHYCPAFLEKHLIQATLRLIFKDLASRYGKRKIFMSAVGSNLPEMPKEVVLPVPAKVVRNYKAPVISGISLTLLFAMLSFSVFDLMQSSHSSGTLDYINLSASEPSLFLSRIHLFLLAIWESLPIANLSFTTILMALFIILGRKMWQLLRINRIPFSFLGGITG